MNKHGARKTWVDGILFDSQGEARRYGELRLLEMAGEISQLSLQPPFVLQEGFRDTWSGKKEQAVEYTADFRYFENDHWVVEDFKGHSTEAFRVRWRLVKRKHPEIEFRIVT